LRYGNSVRDFIFSLFAPIYPLLPLHSLQRCYLWSSSALARATSKVGTAITGKSASFAPSLISQSTFSAAASSSRRRRKTPTRNTSSLRAVSGILIISRTCVMCHRMATSRQDRLHHTMPSGIREGRRNKTLWTLCMRAAHHCDDFDALLDVARTRNAEFLPPLEDGEVVKAARSAWGYTERGDNRFGRPGVFFDADTVNDLIGNDQDLFVLLSFLRANNGPDREFMATNQGLAKRLNWTVKRVAAARRRMTDDGYAEQTRPAYTKQPALYRWIKG
jgi:Primase C terminal 1 (PriCT-1)